MGSIHSAYRERIDNAKGDEFFIVFGDFLAELKDGHVYYRTKGGGEVYPSIRRDILKTGHAYSPFVVRKYFDKELRLTESKSVEYEILPGNIGYAFISDFHEDYLINEFPGVMNYLKNTKGLIIDIRQKRGGDYNNVEAVVSRFISSSMEKPPFYYYGQLADLLPFQPSGSLAYTNPVVVALNGSTFSAGELCTEVLKQLPNVTAARDTTGGGSVGSGDEGLYFLPSGKSMEIGFIDLRRYDNLPWEWLGVPPDIRVEQTEADVLAGRDKQLEYAIEMLK